MRDHILQMLENNGGKMERAFLTPLLLGSSYGVLLGEFQLSDQLGGQCWNNLMLQKQL